MRVPRRVQTLVPVLVLAASTSIASCGGDVTSPAAGSSMELVLHGLRPLDPATEGSYELWAYTSAGDAVSAGRFTLDAGAASGDAHVPFVLPIANPSRIAVTVEPPGDTDQTPSLSELLGGTMDH